MYKRFYLLTMVVCLSLTAMAETKSVTFDFSTPSAIQAWGLTVPTTSNPTALISNLENEDITMVFNSNSPTLTYYQNQYTFYSKSGQSFKFRGENGAIIKRIDFNGFYAQQRFTASPQGFDSGNTYWSGSASEVTLTGTGGNSLFSMTVTYEIESSNYNPLDVNRDGFVTSADVTAVYDVLLGNSSTFQNTADANGDGYVTSADVTAIYDYLLYGTTPLPEVPAPTFNPASGTVFQGYGSVTISGPAESMIYFTIDGSTPTTSHYYSRGSSPYLIEELDPGTTIIKAIAVLNGKASQVATAVYTVEEATDNNINRNSLSSYYIANKYMWRLEWPRIKDDGNQTWLAKSESGYGLALEMEWDNTKIANRFTCYYMDANNSQSNVGRQDSFKEDPEIPEAYRSKLRDYSGSGYARGHLCPSADRRASYDQQALTYYLSNMQPQWQKHNEAQWANLEGDVRKWAARCDTLYVVKAATIDNITLNNVTESGTYSTTYNGTYYEDLKCNGRLLVAKYFYMALLAYNKSTNSYQAMGIWTKHYNEGTTGASGSGSYDWPVINKVSAQYITIDELERRTGIDFFCNLPDDIEREVEGSVNTSYWSSGAPLNR